MLENANITKGPKWAKAKDGGDIIEIMSAQGEIIGTAVNMEDAVLWTAAPELLEAAKFVYREGFTDSYCGFCDRHAPKNDKGKIVGELRHDDECIMERLGAAISKAGGQ